jgi:hypothetical protein
MGSGAESLEATLQKLILTLTGATPGARPEVREFEQVLTYKETAIGGLEIVTPQRNYLFARGQWMSLDIEHVGLAAATAQGAGAH